MSTHPSFGALFQQSRYARMEADPQRVTRQNRQELFAVAGVAFLMKHDDAFRRHFLRTICDVPEEELTNAFLFEVQPEFHADLRISCVSTKSVYIVEFKVGAQLQGKQDPAAPAFFEQPSGYGAIISTAPDYAKFTRKTYIVLQNWKGFEDHQANDIHVVSRTWRELAGNPKVESSITKDLLDTLGGWGIASLRFRNTTGMKKALHTRHAADLFQIITVIAQELAIRPTKYDFDVQPDSGEGAHFGLNIPFGLKHFARLEKLAAQTEGSLGWFGYSSSDDGSSTLDVWIYCKPSKAAETPELKTLEYVEKCLGPKFEGSASRDEGHIRICISGDTVADDKEWFAQVFDSLRSQKA